MLSVSWAMACGWSPCGSNGERSLKSMVSGSRGCGVPGLRGRDHETPRPRNLSFRASIHFSGRHNQPLRLLRCHALVGRYLANSAQERLELVDRDFPLVEILLQQPDLRVECRLL